MSDTDHTDSLEAITDLNLINQIQQFYYREARMLDKRQYQQWMELLAEDISYTVPTRHTPFLDPSLRETEEVLNVDQELNQGIEPPHRDDNYLTLMIRATRSFKLSAWADNPPARTRRFVSNIEVYTSTENTYQVYSNVMLSFSRHEKDNHLYTYHREDALKLDDNGNFKIHSRDVLLDWNVVTGPSLGLLF